MGDLRHNSFKTMMNDVVDFGSCCECGSCVAACPHNVIEMVEGKQNKQPRRRLQQIFVGLVRVQVAMFVRQCARDYGLGKLI